MKRKELFKNGTVNIESVSYIVRHFCDDTSGTNLIYNMCCSLGWNEKIPVIANAIVDSNSGLTGKSEVVARNTIVRMCIALNYLIEFIKRVHKLTYSDIYGELFICNDINEIIEFVSSCANGSKETIEKNVRKKIFSWYKNEYKGSVYREIGESYVKEMLLTMHRDYGVKVCADMDDVIYEMKIIAIGEIVHTAEKFKNAYFFEPPRSASERENYSNYYSQPGIEWEDGGNKYYAEFNVSCSCRNVYAGGAYYKNGKVTNLTAIRNSYKRLYKEYYGREAA